MHILWMPNAVVVIVSHFILKKIRLRRIKLKKKCPDRTQNEITSSTGIACFLCLLLATNKTCGLGSPCETEMVEKENEPRKRSIFFASYAKHRLQKLDRFVNFF